MVKNHEYDNDDDDIIINYSIMTIVITIFTCVQKKMPVWIMLPQE